MMQKWSTYSDLTRVFLAIALATGIATLFNLIMSQWFLALFFAVIAVVSWLVAVRKMKAEDSVRNESAETGDV